MALMFAAMNYTYLTSMTHTTAANAIWLQNVAPVWVFLIGVFLFRETVHPGDWLLVLCGALGVGFILFFEASRRAIDGRALWAGQQRVLCRRGPERAAAAEH